MTGGTAIIVWILFFVVIFYFLAIRPQRRQKQAHSQMERMLKKGDEIVTIGGMFGTVTRIGDEWVELEIAKRTKVRYMKRAISSITEISEDEDEDDEFIEAADEDVVDVADEDWVEDDELTEDDEEDVADEDDDEEDVADEDDETTEEEPAAPEAPKA
ncbi:MAG TPA: preprotein translocase subunit YajC [Thermoleophilia bacterium]|nr:preprotein translocase subunit YajC [Thermoleophilia bacterium]